MSRHACVVFFVLAALAFAACSGGESPSSGIAPDEKDASGQLASQSLKTEQENGGCPSAPSELIGSVAAGGACTSYANCKPTCCACGESLLAAACVDGKCASAVATCALATNGTCATSGGDAGNDAKTNPDGGGP